MNILISGASIAGPVLAYWLERYGFRPTVVERAPALRKAGGHAVDLFRPAMEIVERMGVLAQIEGRRTDTDFLTLRREGVERSIDVDVRRIMRVFSDRHVEIMRDDLSECFYEVTRDRVEYVFGDSITALAEDEDGVDVTFERGAPRRFDLVIGADGLHSNVRRLVFGDEREFSAFIGAYLAVMTLPNYLGLEDRALVTAGVGRMAALYSARHMDDARAVFLFRSPNELRVHHRDVARQKAIVRERFADAGGELPRMLAELDHTPAFYFDSITQLRMDTWSRGRVTLAGDAGYCPGPAVGGSTSLAIVGAYVLAGELAAARGDHVRGFAAGEAALRPYVEASRTFAVHAARRLIPESRRALWLFAQAAWLFDHTPRWLIQALARLTGSGTVRIHEAVEVKDYSHLVVPREPAAGHDGAQNQTAKPVRA
jgi:2-polyprenyl-6-methoxyphenol hydroxylase-like FAD-dependent oxidoreductase